MTTDRLKSLFLHLIYVKSKKKELPFTYLRIEVLIDDLFLKKCKNCSIFFCSSNALLILQIFPTNTSGGMFCREVRCMQHHCHARYSVTERASKRLGIALSFTLWSSAPDTPFSL